MELWIEKKKKNNAHVAAVDSQEMKLTRKVHENGQVRDEYVAKVKSLQNRARAIMACMDDWSTAGNPHLGRGTPPPQRNGA